MWVLTAEFDGAGKVEEGTGIQKSKLLKTGKSYVLGRKEQPLIVNYSKISREHGQFVVSKFTQEDVADATTRPTLEYTNMRKDKMIPVTRGETIHSVNPLATLELLDGDIVAVASRVLIRVRWNEVCCYQQATTVKSATLTLCASLGIHIVNKQVQNVTHHLVNAYAATTLHALSLLSASTFVKPEWLDEVLRLGKLAPDSDSSNGIPLEHTFILPPTAKYRPTFNAGLPPEQKTFKVWEPNEERLTMFAQYRFLCVGESKREVDSGVRDLLTRAGGKVDVIDVSSGLPKFRKALVRGKAKNEKLVLLAEEASCDAAIGKDSWEELVNEARTFVLRFFASRDIIQAILNTDTSKFDSSDPPDEQAPSSSPLPNIVPNTLPDEESVPVPEKPNSEVEPELEPTKPPLRKLTRRATSRQPSQEPAPKPAEEDEPPPPPKRKPLTRRVQGGGMPVITGLDDPSILVNHLPDDLMSAPAVDPGPAKPRPKLKRRLGTAAAAEALAANSLMSGVEPEVEPGEEPPLKKFKALFEASDPRNSGAEGMSMFQESGALEEDDGPMFTAEGGTGSQTQTETQTQKSGKRSGAARIASLRAVREEEEEEESQSTGATGNELGKKRKERSFDGDDVEMADVEDALNGASGTNTASGSGPALKKRAVPENAVQRATSNVAKHSNDAEKAQTVAGTKLGKKGSAATSAGAANGKPDTDTVFLKAIASTKRGKKTEDDFDRDFNNLRISKADLQVDEGEKRPAWELLALEDFGDESNLRGNFMVIQDLEVFKVDGGGSRKKAAGTTDPRWESKPDFKKFKKQNTIAPVARKPRTKVELFISDGNDAGLGPAYWKGSNSQSRSQEEDFGPQTQAAKKTTQAQTKASQARGKTPAMDFDSDKEMALPPPAQPTQTRKRSKPPSKVAAEPEPPTKRTRTTRAGSKAPSQASKSATLFRDESDDEDVKMSTLDEDVFNLDGGQTQTLPSSDEPPRRSTRAPPKKKGAAAVIVDEDSDDGAVFTGFGKKKTRR